MSHVFHVTYFEDKWAKIKKEAMTTLEELAEQIETQAAEQKEQLPWLKLAEFGETRAPVDPATGRSSGSLRHDDNVLLIHGVEADYDGEQIAFDDAVDRLHKAGIMAIVHTSPSHTPATPRWRVLAPTSGPLNKLAREQLVARLNGIFEGALDPASFAISQSYLFGHLEDAGKVVVRKNGAVLPGENKVIITPGHFIDTAVHLDATAVGRKHKSNGSAGGTFGGVDMDDLINQFLSGASLHPSALSMIGLWAHDGIRKEATLSFMRAIYDAAKQPRYAGRWPELVRVVDDIYAKEDAKRAGRAVAHDDFYYCSPENKYIHTPTGALWKPATVNMRLPVQGGIKPSTWIGVNRPVEQMTWAPGKPQIIKDEYIVSGGWNSHPGGQVFNHYRPPRPHLGRHDMAGPWRDHLHTIFPSEARHIELWLGCRHQRPHVKINHAIVLGGAQGIGKDALLEGPRHAVGHWNCASVSPIQLLGRFNGFLKSVLLIVSEARDLGEVNRPNFYEHTKAIITSPPDVLYIDEKNTHPYYIPNLCGVIITTNHKTAGIYLPSDDRRHFVAWSPLERADLDDKYFERLWGFYMNGGLSHAAAYLTDLDISDFDPFEPPPKTDAFHEIVTTGVAPEVGELQDAIELLGNPDVVVLTDLTDLTSMVDPEFAARIKSEANRRMLPRWMEGAHYVIVKNPNNAQGNWNINGKRQIAYATVKLTADQRRDAVRRRARI